MVNALLVCCICTIYCVRVLYKQYTLWALLRGILRVIFMTHDIKLFIVDVDGVLTNGTIWYDKGGEEYKVFHTHDGLGLKRLREQGIHIAIVSGRNSLSVTRRMKELEITEVYQGISDKLEIFNSLLHKFDIAAENVVSIGDDLPDIPILESSGVAIAVHNAVAPVKAIANYCTSRSGGEGAVREACEWILSARLEKTHESNTLV